jgi:hypothetical protein
LIGVFGGPGCYQPSEDRKEKKIVTGCEAPAGLPSAVAVDGATVEDLP